MGTRGHGSGSASRATPAATCLASLVRLLDAGWAVSARYPFLWHLPAVPADQDRDRHGPVVDRLHEIIRRGQDSGDFDRSLSPDWLLAAALALGRAAEDEVKAGRMTIEAATQAVHHSFLRLFTRPGGQQPAGKPMEQPGPAH